MNLNKFLIDAVKLNASDIFILAYQPLSYKVNGRLYYKTENSLTPIETANLINEIFALSLIEISNDTLTERDFIISLPEIGRFRVNVFCQSSTVGAVIRVIPFVLPDPRAINLPDVILNFANLSRGLVLITGTAGSGKSTTLACILDKINKTRDCHIITIEDPIEYKHHHKLALITQREIGTDTPNYKTALKSLLRQAPNVIFIGEMRDYETISAAISAAETGHLVFSTLHTTGAASSVERIIDSFPHSAQNQVRLQLSLNLQAVVSQQLIPTIDAKLHPIFEVLIANSAIKNLIREGNTHQINNTISTSRQEQMIDMDTSIFNLLLQKKINTDTALKFSINPRGLASKINEA